MTKDELRTLRSIVHNVDEMVAIIGNAQLELRRVGVNMSTNRLIELATDCHRLTDKLRTNINAL